MCNKTTSLLALLVATASGAAPCPSRASWPSIEWPVERSVDDAHRLAVDELERTWFTTEGPDELRRGLRTDSLLIVHHGTIRYERYARGFDATKPHLSWSVAKSITSALVGVAVQHQRLSIDQPLCDFLTEYQGVACQIRVRDVLTYSSGLGWQEGYEDAPLTTSSVVAMLFGVGHRDHLAHILGHRVIAAPGLRWSYSTGDAELAAAVAKRALATDDAFWSLLFEPIGMRSTVVQQDAKGTPLGGSSIFATPRDFARFGYLYLNDGCWNGERLLPAGWVAQSTTASTPYLESAPENEHTPFGFTFWLNQPRPEKRATDGTLIHSALPRPWPDVPPDAYLAHGHWGQRIIIVPSADVVIVRTADDRDPHRDDQADINTLIRQALAVVQ